MITANEKVLPKDGQNMNKNFKLLPTEAIAFFVRLN